MEIESSERQLFSTELHFCLLAAVGTNQPFCNNPTAMNAAWRRYWKEMFYYSRYIVGGLLVSLIPFLLNFNSWRDKGSLLDGLLSSLMFGLVVSITIWSTFAATFAGMTLINIKTGWPFRAPKYFVIVVAGLGMLLGWWIISHIRGNPVEGSDWLSAMVFGGLILMLFFFHFAYRQAREEALTHRAAAAEARHRALEHQMRPHFLFNSLNSLAELIESGSRQAGEMTQKLSDLYRMILQNSHSKTSTLKSEIEIVCRYLELEQLRFGSRLRFSIEIPESADEIYIPSLIAQTLVENAVKHGISKSVEGGFVFVKVIRITDKFYQLAVSNTGEPLLQNANAGAGLANTRARLDLLYGDRHEFKVGSDAQGATVASFSFTGEKIG